MVFLNTQANICDEKSFKKQYKIWIMKTAHFHVIVREGGMQRLIIAKLYFICKIQLKCLQKYLKKDNDSDCCDK